MFFIVLKFCLLIGLLTNQVHSLKNPCHRDSDQEFFPHPKYDDKYIQCTKLGHMFVFTCPKSLKWIQEKGMCDKESTVKSINLQFSTNNMNSTQFQQTVPQLTNDQIQQPMQPMQPTQPFQPMQPTHPTQPVQPTQPIQPMQPTQPSQPMQPTQPFQPMQPTHPTQPVQPTQPMQTKRQPISTSCSTVRISGSKIEIVNGVYTQSKTSETTPIFFRSDDIRKPGILTRIGSTWCISFSFSLADTSTLTSSRIADSCGDLRCCLLISDTANSLDLFDETRQWKSRSIAHSLVKDDNVSLSCLSDTVQRECADISFCPPQCLSARNGCNICECDGVPFTKDHVATDAQVSVPNNSITEPVVAKPQQPQQTLTEQPQQKLTGEHLMEEIVREQKIREKQLLEQQVHQQQENIRRSQMMTRNQNIKNQQIIDNPAIIQPITPRASVNTQSMQTTNHAPTESQPISQPNGLSMSQPSLHGMLCKTIAFVNSQFGFINGIYGRINPQNFATTLLNEVPIYRRIDNKAATTVIAPIRNKWCITLGFRLDEIDSLTPQIIESRCGRNLECCIMLSDIEMQNVVDTNTFDLLSTATSWTIRFGDHKGQFDSELKLKCNDPVHMNQIPGASIVAISPRIIQPIDSNTDVEQPNNKNEVQTHDTRDGFCLALKIESSEITFINGLYTKLNLSSESLPVYKRADNVNIPGLIASLNDQWCITFSVPIIGQMAITSQRIRDVCGSDGRCCLLKSDTKSSGIDLTNSQREWKINFSDRQGQRDAGIKIECIGSTAFNINEQQAPRLPPQVQMQNVQAQTLPPMASTSSSHMALDQLQQQQQEIVDKLQESAIKVKSSDPSICSNLTISNSQVPFVNGMYGIVGDTNLFIPIFRRSDDVRLPGIISVVHNFWCISFTLTLNDLESITALKVTQKCGALDCCILVSNLNDGMSLIDPKRVWALNIREAKGKIDQNFKIECNEMKPIESGSTELPKQQIAQPQPQPTRPVQLQPQQPTVPKPIQPPMMPLDGFGNQKESQQPPQQQQANQQPTAVQLQPQQPSGQQQQLPPQPPQMFMPQIPNRPSDMHSAPQQQQMFKNQDEPQQLPQPIPPQKPPAEFQPFQPIHPIDQTQTQPIPPQQPSMDPQQMRPMPPQFGQEPSSQSQPMQPKQSPIDKQQIRPLPPHLSNPQQMPPFEQSQVQPMPPQQPPVDPQQMRPMPPQFGQQPQKIPQQPQQPPFVDQQQNEILIIQQQQQQQEQVLRQQQQEQALIKQQQQEQALIKQQQQEQRRKQEQEQQRQIQLEQQRKEQQLREQQQKLFMQQQQKLKLQQQQEQQNRTQMGGQTKMPSMQNQQPTQLNTDNIPTVNSITQRFNFVPITNCDFINCGDGMTCESRCPECNPVCVTVGRTNKIEETIKCGNINCPLSAVCSLDTMDNSLKCVLQS